jgi:DNA-binding transcriptional LysR family regulator
MSTTTYCSAPPKHPLLRKRSLRLADVLEFPLVIGTKGTRSRAHIDEVFHRQGLAEKTRIAVETNSTAITCAGVRAGAGIGIVAAPAEGTLSRGLGVRSLQRWFGKARFVFIWRRGAIVTPLQRQLAEHIRSSSA